MDNALSSLSGDRGLRVSQLAKLNDSSCLSAPMLLPPRLVAFPRVDTSEDSRDGRFGETHVSIWGPLLRTALLLLQGGSDDL